MKNIIITISLLFLISSCSDFLEITPEISVTSDSFFETQQDFEQAIIGTYSPLQNIYNADWISNELVSDNTFFVFNVGQRGPKPMEDFATFTLETNNVHLYNKWTWYYLIISRANQILGRVDEADFDQVDKDNIKGQALFLRAYSYFELVKTFGGVPFFLNVPESSSETFRARSSSEEIYSSIEADLHLSKDLLLDKSNQTEGKVTSGAAFTLLGNVLLTQKKWNEAETVLKQVTEMGYNLLPVYEDVFKPSNKGNDELIFEIWYLDATGFNVGSTFLYSFIPTLTDPSIITNVSPAAQNAGGFNVPTKDLIESYEDLEIDQRFASSIGFHSGPSPIVGIEYNNIPYVKKYLHPHSRYGETDQNWPVYRYSDVLLMISESLNEQGKVIEATNYLNMVRNRAGLNEISGSSQTEMKELILNERRIEFAFENKRWQDLIRAEKGVSVMNEFGEKVINKPLDYYYPIGSGPLSGSFEVTENNLVFPIPINEIIINPDLHQNSGY